MCLLTCCTKKGKPTESPHGHLKHRIQQAFLLRGSYDFLTVEAYQLWLEQVVHQHNRRNAKAIDIEKLVLQPLPTYKTASYTILPVRVSSSSTIQVRASLYSVPARLIGATLQIHLYDDRLSCYLGGVQVAELSRVYGNRKKKRAKNIDYRHVIDSLVKKPMAFFHSQIRDALLPNAQYQEIWQVVKSRLPSREASRLMVGILYIAAKINCETALGDQVTELLQAGELPLLCELNQFWGVKEAPHYSPAIVVTQHTLESYNQLIPVRGEAGHAIH